MILRNFTLRFVPLLALGILVLSCSTVTPDAGLSALLPSELPPPTLTPPPIPTSPPTLTPLPTLTLTPVLARDPIRLVVLHTNDNWGETEPCG